MRFSDSDMPDHMHLVDKVAAAFRRRLPPSVQHDDLRAAGALGLLHALRSSEHDSAEMFTAYARMRIRGAILDELRRQDYAPRRTRREPTDNVPAREPVAVVSIEDAGSEAAFPSDDASPLACVVAKAQTEDVRNAIGRLSPREQEVIRLRYYAEIPSKEVATRLGVSEARVSQLHAKATERLRSLLEGEAQLGHAA